MSSWHKPVQRCLRCDTEWMADVPTMPPAQGWLADRSAPTRCWCCGSTEGVIHVRWHNTGELIPNV